MSGASACDQGFDDRAGARPVLDRLSGSRSPNFARSVERVVIGAGRAAPRAPGRSARTASRAMSTRGCFSSAASATGSAGSRASSQSSAMRRPASVSRSGAPCETLGAMPQRASLASMRRARPASGVTTAALPPGVSKPSRSSSAMAVASSSSVAASSRRRPSSAFLRRTPRRRRRRGARASRRSFPPAPALRASARGGRGRVRLRIAAAGMSRRSTPSAASVSLQRVLRDADRRSGPSYRRRDRRRRPGSTTTPRGRRATTRISSRVVACEPVEPAMMIGRFGGSAFQRAASARRSAAPCSAGSLRPCSFRCAGQNVAMMSRKAAELAQWRARSISSTSFGSFFQST